METDISNYQKPLVYACSGGSCLGQLAHDLAVWLDAEGIATMASIAGVGGQVDRIVEQAQSSSAIIAIEGCDDCCVEACLARCRVKPRWRFNLAELNIETSAGQPCSLADTYRALRHIHDGLGLDLSHPLPTI